MHKSIEGVCRNGKIELLEPVPADSDGRVIVTFLAPGQIDLENRGIDKDQAADLRKRLGAFTEDWDRPEMDAYDAI